MITLAHKHFETEMELKDDSPLVIFAEEPRENFSFVQNMISLAEGRESEFSIWKGADRLDAEEKIALLRDFFEMDFSDKKILNLLYKRIRGAFFDGAFMLSLNEINAEIGRLFEALFAEVDFSLDYSDLELDALLKACGVKPSVQYENLLEAIVCYIDLFVRLKNVEVFVLVGAKQVLTDEDLASLYYHCELAKVKLLLLEHYKTRPLLHNERAITITEDLCEIVENMESL